jgi:hypothetical protein
VEIKVPAAVALPLDRVWSSCYVPWTSVPIPDYIVTITIVTTTTPRLN